MNFKQIYELAMGPKHGTRIRVDKLAPAWKGHTPGVAQETRQQMRRHFFELAFDEITYENPKESHAARKKLAWDRSKALFTQYQQERRIHV